MGYWGYHPRYKPSRPRPVRDGLRTRKGTGQIGETWWARRFLEVLDAFGWSNRLARGKSYARRGQVIDYKIDVGVITSKVQGSRSRPYKIRIEVRTLSSGKWLKVLKVMSSQARFAAKLLSGEMPRDIEDVFEQAKVPLFPTSVKDFDAHCSCPDWANPCKHIAAVCYIVGEAFDRDPFLIFHLRGLKRDELLRRLHKESDFRKTEEEAREEEGEEEGTIEPLTIEPVIFWKGNRELDYHLSFKSPPLDAAILHRLGVPQFWMETEKEFHKTMEKVYKNISNSAIEIAYTSKEDK